MTRETEPRPNRPFGDLSDTGMLWLINRVVFHPRGFALAISRDDDGDATGWAMQGMGDEVWTFTAEADDECFAKAEAFLAALRTTPESPEPAEVVADPALLSPLAPNWPLAKEAPITGGDA